MFLLSDVKIDHEYALFSEFSVSQIYFELEGISEKKWSSNFRGFTVYTWQYHLMKRLFEIKGFILYTWLYYHKIHVKLLTNYYGSYGPF